MNYFIVVIHYKLYLILNQKFIFFNFIFSHLMGTFYRTIRLVENGIKPVYVFDGKPPQMKSSELEKRADRRQEAQKALEKAEELGMDSYCWTYIKYLNKKIIKYLSVIYLLFFR